MFGAYRSGKHESRNSSFGYLTNESDIASGKYAKLGLMW